MSREQAREIPHVGTHAGAHLGQHATMPVVRQLPLLRKFTTDTWRATAVWAAALLAAMVLYLPLYPSIGGTSDMQALLASLPPELIKALNYDQIASGPGYTQATFFGLLGFLLLSIVAVGTGAAAVGGDEDAGLLELTLAHGVTRTRVVLERALGLLLRLAALCAFVFVLILLLNEPSQLGLVPPNLLAGTGMLLLLVLLSGNAALLAGAAGGRKVHGTVAGSAVAVLGYTFNALGNQSADLEWLHALSPYHWAYGGSPLVNGMDWGAFAALAGINAALVVLAVVALRRRDVGGA